MANTLFAVSGLREDFLFPLPPGRAPTPDQPRGSDSGVPGPDAPVLLAEDSVGILRGIEGGGGSIDAGAGAGAAADEPAPLSLGASPPSVVNKSSK